VVNSAGRTGTIVFWSSLHKPSWAAHKEQQLQIVDRPSQMEFRLQRSVVTAFFIIYYYFHFSHCRKINLAIPQEDGLIFFPLNHFYQVISFLHSYFHFIDLCGLSSCFSSVLLLLSKHLKQNIFKSQTYKYNSVKHTRIIS